MAGRFYWDIAKQNDAYASIEVGNDVPALTEPTINNDKLLHDYHLARANAAALYGLTTSRMFSKYLATQGRGGGEKAHGKSGAHISGFLSK